MSGLLDNQSPHVRVLAENLYKAVKAVKRTELSPLPVLNHAWLRTDDGELLVSTHSLETPLTAHCPARVNEDFSTCVLMVHKCEVWDNGNKRKLKFYPFIDYLKVMTEQTDILDLYFNPDLQILTIKADTSVTEFKCMSAEDFPPVREESNA